MRVIYAEPGVMLRMTGALGPLQGEALLGTLTIELRPVEGGTELTWTYAVGGHSRFALEQIAGDVDAVQSEQMQRLADQVVSAPAQ